MKFRNQILGRFKGEERGAVVLRNMAGSIAVKAVGIAVSLFLVPLTLGYLAEEEYGIWLTLSSMLAWIGFFDIGLTNGLRNKLTEALTVGDQQRAKTYISTTLVLLVGLIGTLILLFSIAYNFIDWQSVFNSKALTSEALGRVVFFTIAFFGVQFVLKIVTALYFAVHKAALADSLNMLGQLIALAVIWALTLVTPKGDLLYIAAVYSAIPVLVFLIAYFVAFNGKYRYIRPSIKSINFKYSKDLIGLGLQFFVSQSAALILFTTSNFIITQMFGPSEVTVYNIAFKYFSIVTMGFTIIMSPMWNAYTEAYVKKDFQWMRRAITKMQKLWVLSVVGTILMVVVSPWIYELWVGRSIATQIPISLSVACAVYVTLFVWSNILGTMLNGVGKIKLSLYGSCVIMIIYIPLAIWLSSVFGVNGILYSLAIVLLPGAVLGVIQTNKIINQTAKGIWNK